jgi:hypothetical protein
MDNNIGKQLNQQRNYQGGATHVVGELRQAPRAPRYRFETRAMLHLGVLALLVGAFGCGSPSVAGSTPIQITSTEFDFASPLGTQAVPNWEGVLRNSGNQPFAVLTADDGVIYPEFQAYPVSFVKVTKTGAVKWTTAVSFAGDPSFGFRSEPESFAMTLTSDGSTFMVGGLYTATTNGFGAALLGPDGTLVWAKTLDPRMVAVSNVTLLAQPSGDFIFTATLTNLANGNIDPVETKLYRIGRDGTVKATVKILPIHVAEYDHPGISAVVSTVLITTPLGESAPVIRSIVPMADGGFVVAGYYYFARLIRCGSEAAPADPPSPNEGCRQQGSDAMLIRYDGMLNEVWSKHYGDGFLTSVQPGNLTVLGDGSLLATGLVYPHGADQNPTVEALALSVAPDGALRWIQSHPWGKAPGTRLFDGVISFNQVLATTATDVVLVMATPTDSPCTLVRMRNDGTLLGVQPLVETMPNYGGTPYRCTGAAGGPGFLVHTLKTLFRFNPVQ